jgi:hypothetical protein
MTRLYDPSLEDIRRELLKFRFDPAYRGRDQRVPIDAFARFVGVTRQTLYSLMARVQLFDLTAATRLKIGTGIAMVTMKGMRWRRRNGAWAPYMPDGSTPAGLLMEVQSCGGKQKAAA